MTLKEYIKFDYKTSLTFSEFVYEIFNKYFRGKQGAIKRDELLHLINTYQFCGTYTDREMRQAYEKLAICSTPKGLYLLKTEDERREQIALRMKLIYAHFRKIRVLREYKIESDAIQKELF